MTYIQEYNREAKNLSDSELKAKFKGVEKAWATAYKTQEEKLNLATQTYEMVNQFFWTKTPLIVVTFLLNFKVRCVRCSTRRFQSMKIPIYL